MKDEIIEELHKIREAHAKKFNYDLNAICEDYKISQLKHGDRLVTLKPKLLPGKKLAKLAKKYEGKK